MVDWQRNKNTLFREEIAKKKKTKKERIRRREGKIELIDEGRRTLVERRNHKPCFSTGLEIFPEVKRNTHQSNVTFVSIYWFSWWKTIRDMLQ